jgi:hypothetical protein
MKSKADKPSRKRATTTLSSTRSDKPRPATSKCQIQPPSVALPPPDKKAGTKAKPRPEVEFKTLLDLIRGSAERLVKELAPRQPTLHRRKQLSEQDT